MACFMMPTPTKSMPKPMMVMPHFFMTRCLKKDMTTPMMMAGMLMPLILKATICPVTVVPMWEPRMMPMDCFSVNRPALTKPTTMTVVAPDDWMREVTMVPVRMATKRFFAKRWRMERRRCPATPRSPSPISCME